MVTDHGKQEEFETTKLLWEPKWIDTDSAIDWKNGVEDPRTSERPGGCRESANDLLRNSIS